MSSRRGSDPLALDACSACAGNYEDPERTAWSDSAQEEDEAEQGSKQEDASELQAPASDFLWKETDRRGGSR
jgi:hypothetical protein